MRSWARIGAVTVVASVGAAVAVSNCSGTDSNTVPEVTQIAQPVLTGTEWKPIGPFGIRSFAEGQQRYAGTVLSLALDNAGGVLAGSGNGGLFKYVAASNSWSPLSDALPYKAIHAIWVKPTDPQTIVIATGWDSAGGPLANGGLFRTGNAGGDGWPAPTQPDPSAWVYNFASDPADPAIVYAATGVGIWKSTTSGQSFTQVAAGNFTSVVPHPATPNWLYAFLFGTGVVRSTNGGTTWTSLHGTSCDTTCNTATPCVGNVGSMFRTSLAISPEDPYTIYVFSQAPGGALHGYFQLHDNASPGSALWCNLTSRLSAAPWTHQLQRNQLISVAPKAAHGEPDKILVGGVNLCTSQNGGPNNGQAYDCPSLGPRPPGMGMTVHADMFDAKWVSPTQAYVATDGGIYQTSDGGVTWSESSNTIPSVMGLGLDVQNVYPYRIWGASWDIGVHWTCNFWPLCPSGSNWGSWTSNDGALWADTTEILVDSHGTGGVFATMSPAGAAPWNRYRSADNGQTWPMINSGLATADLGPNAYFASDRLPNSTIYTNGVGVYSMSAPYTTWSRFGGPFTDSAGGAPLSVDQLNVARYLDQGAMKTVVYAPIVGIAKSLRVYDGAWFNRGAAFPTGAAIARLGVPESGKGPVYAVLGGAVATNQKVWRTADNGVTWTAAAGVGLPTSVNLTDAAVHPLDPNTVYVASTTGVYKSVDRGATFTDWAAGAGMPSALYIRHLRNHWSGLGLQLVAQTMGRSNWTRDVDYARRTHASRCVVTSGAVSSDSSGQVYNNSTSTAAVLFCPIDNNQKAQSQSSRAVRVDGKARNSGGIKASYCLALKAGGSGPCGTEASFPSGVFSLGPLNMPAAPDPQDYVYLKVTLGTRSGSNVNSLSGYGYRAGD